MKKKKLNFRFHNPNTQEASADYIVQIFIAANTGRVEQILNQNASKGGKEEDERENRCVS
ncbi:hypothetical protein GN277_23890 [Lachnospiraceae bacterium WCA-9-b2]|uniref:Uncharacterized protein n=1 Tax=Sporofaciens musculi TaxID=2681861 RepID=A0A7X3SLD4_9FIRM|nr:hypothetical protein [Sporofaciens musculi]